MSRQRCSPFCRSFRAHLFGHEHKGQGRHEQSARQGGIVYIGIGTIVVILIIVIIVMLMRGRRV